MVSVNQSVGDSALSGSRAQTDTTEPPFGGARLPLRASSLRVEHLIELYMAQYAGRDPSRVRHLRWWVAKIGKVTLGEISDDEVHAALQELAGQPAKFYAGKDAEARPILKSKHRPLSAATQNRYAAALGAVLTWSIKNRIAPKGFKPCMELFELTLGGEPPVCRPDSVQLRSVISAPSPETAPA